jgi:cellulose synthase/poly-beta-1,6-N-acetylglucosamine synthase-like glycosyltransferase
MLVKCTLESFIFGVAYGLYFLKYTKKDLLFFSGRWEYSTWSAIFGHFATIAVICVTLGGIFIVLLPRILKVTFLDYLSNTAGMILIGFTIVYLLPKF